jgi:lysozyme family protein
MHLSTRFRRTTVLAAGAAAVGLAGLGIANPAQAATVSPARSTVITSEVRALASQSTENLGLTTREAQAIQRFVAARYGYTGAINGELGTDSWMALQRELVKFGSYSGPIDGLVDTDTVAALQQLLAPPIAGYTGPIDGVVNSATEAAFALYAETLIEDDGV